MQDVARTVNSLATAESEKFRLACESSSASYQATHTLDPGRKLKWLPTAKLTSTALMLLVAMFKGK